MKQSNLNTPGKSIPTEWKFSPQLLWQRSPSVTSYVAKTLNITEQQAANYIAKEREKAGIKP